MFLSELSTNEKEAFLGLCYEAARANEIIEKEEIELIKSYCNEMEIAYLNEEEAWDYDPSIQTISTSTLRIRKIVLFEIIGLMLADGEYDAKEKKAVSQMGEKIGLTEQEVDDITSMLMDYYDIVELINNKLNL